MKKKAIVLNAVIYFVVAFAFCKVKQSNSELQ